ncbi:MAG: ABC-2 family transporter protein [Actinomycetota bacterium]
MADALRHRPSISWSDRFRLYRMILAARIRSDWQYRVSFLALLVSQVGAVGLDLVAIAVVLQLVPDLGGWTAAEVAFLYGLATLPFGISDVFVSTVDRVSNYVRDGSMDRVLLRPVPALLQISALEFELRRAGKLVPAIAALVWSLPRVDVSWTAGQIAVLVMALCCGTVIYSALWVMAASMSFWTISSKEALNAVTYGGQFANQYPLHIYRNWVRAVLGWGIPLAFVAYVPSTYILDATNPLGLPRWLVLTSVPVAGAAAAVAGLIWRTGIRHYQSTGS